MDKGRMKPIWQGIGANIVSAAAMIGAIWFFGEPAVEKFFKQQYDIHEAKKVEINSHKVALRILFSQEMEVNPDRVHIVEGEMYKQHLIIKQMLPDIQDYLSKKPVYVYINSEDHLVGVRKGREYELTRNAGFLYYFSNNDWRAWP